MNQRFDDVHKTLRTKDERGKSPLCGSPFIQEIQDVSILQHFHLPMLEAYDGSSDPMEHVAAFHVQMALYGMSNAIMCWAFSTTLRGIARGWYDRLPPSSIHSFDQLAREFEVNFLASVRPKPTTTSLLRMRQREDEHLGRYLAHFTEEIRVIPDMHPLLKRPRAEHSQGPPPWLPRKRTKRAKQTVPRPPNIPLNSTWIEIFL
ncbi:hypothetical protein BHE74_00000363 [Ensete ventricosum]|nr:hypothetical protein BHE74_00000363 [Ensete ventricosum]RZS17279.1 hypothetical protein BHM03_00049405 [Ensete ventricosum]